MHWNFGRDYGIFVQSERHQILVFVLSTLSNLRGDSFITGKVAIYVQNASLKLHVTFDSLNFEGSARMQTNTKLNNNTVELDIAMGEYF